MPREVMRSILHNEVTQLYNSLISIERCFTINKQSLRTLARIFGTEYPGGYTTRVSYFIIY